MAFSVEGLAASLARLADRESQPAWQQSAVRLFGAAAALREAMGNSARRSWFLALPPPGRDEYERQVAAMRAALGAEAFNLAWAEGQQLALEQTIAESIRGGVWPGCDPRS